MMARTYLRVVDLSRARQTRLPRRAHAIVYYAGSAPKRLHEESLQGAVAPGAVLTDAPGERKKSKRRGVRGTKGAAPRVRFAVDEVGKRARARPPGVQEQTAQLKPKQGGRKIARGPAGS
jgi:hypothetical protein